jgi:hypothetical protein
VRWGPVLAGGGVAVLVSLVVSLAALAAGSDALLVAATPLGIAAGGAAAGRLARAAGALQGGMVAVLWIIAEALADVFGPPATDVAAEVALTLLGDAARIAIGALFGWVAARGLAPPSAAPARRR